MAINLIKDFSHLAKKIARNTNKWESTFIMEGQVTDLTFRDGKPKELELYFQGIKLRIKISSRLYHADWNYWKGKTIKISGTQKVYFKTGEIKFKAKKIISPHTSKQSTILMCQKSHCMKRGGKSVCASLNAEITKQNLDGQVVVKGTGCMKRCKEAVNLVMPDKTRHSSVRSQDVPRLIASIAKKRND